MKLFKTVNNYCKLPTESEVVSARKGILIVDDSKFSRSLLKDILKTEGFLIVGEAGDGLEAIEMAHELKPEYIFMDVEMPKLDGIAAIPRILGFDPEINIIMCTALGQKNIILEAAKAGAKDYVLKPYMKENIIGVLNIIANKKQNDVHVIPFKAGKKYQDVLTKPIANVEVSNIDYEIKEDSTAENIPDIVTEMEEFLEPLEFEEDNIFDEGLDSIFDSDTLGEYLAEEVLDSYVNDQAPEKIESEEEAEPEEAKVNQMASEEYESSEEYAEYSESKMNEETSEDKETLDDSETEEEAISAEVKVNDETSEDEEPIEACETEEEAASAEAKVYDETSEDEEPIEACETEEETTSAEVKMNDETSEDEEPIEACEIEVEAASTEAKVNDEPSEACEIEEESASAEAKVSEEPLAVDETEEQAETQEAKVNEESTVDDSEEEIIANWESNVIWEAKVNWEGRVNEEVPEDVKTDWRDISNNSDNSSDDLSYTYLWNNRFDISEKEYNVQNTMSHRVSFYEYAYLENDRYDLFGKDNTQREMVLGMMNAYMSLDNRFQQKNSISFGLRALTYVKETRLYSSNILEESDNKFAEITITNAIKYNSLKPLQTSQEILKKIGLYQSLSDLVNGKSGRVLR